MDIYEYKQALIEIFATDDPIIVFVNDDETCDIPTPDTIRDAWLFVYLNTYARFYLAGKAPGVYAFNLTKRWMQIKFELTPVDMPRAI